jgi:autotransporter-associated beta strand protein
MKTHSFLLFSVATVLAASSAHALSFFWDAVPLTASNQNGDGNWDLATQNWIQTAGGATNIVWNNDGTHTAFLGNASGTGYTNPTVGGTITLAQTTNLASLSMSSGQSGSYIVNGGDGITLHLSGVSSIGNNNTTASLTVNAIVSGSTGLNKINNGRIILTGANTYTGATTINAGILSVNSIKNVGNVSALGAPTTVASGTIAIGSGITTGTLAYTGTGDTSDRVLNLSGASGGATIDQSGSGSLKFTSAPTATGTGSKTLTLQGSTGGSGEIGGAITNNTTTGSTVSTATSTTSTLLTLGSVDGLTVGAGITGTGITASTTISAINASTKVVTLSAAASVASGATITSAGLVNITSLTKAGTGTWTLSGANTYTGRTTISGGALDVGTVSAGALSNSGLLFSGGVLQGNGSFTRNFSGSATAGANTLSGLTGGFAAKGGALTVNFGGAGALVQLSSGSFRFGTNLIFGSATADSKVTVVNPLNLNNGSRTITVDSGVGGDSAELQGIVRNDGALALSQVLTKAGAGTLTLSAANTYSSDTQVTGGTLALGNNLALQNSALDTSGAGVVRMTGFTTPTFGGLKGGANLATIVTTGYSSVTSLTLNPGTGATPAYSGVIADGAAGMTLTKSGLGLQTLSGANTYTGSTVISAGTLALGAAGSFANSPVISVASGATFNVSAVTGGWSAEGSNAANRQKLTGAGGVTGAATIGSFGTHNAGDNGVGSQAFSSSLNYANGSIFEWDLNASSTASGFDTVAAVGTIDVGSSTVFKVLFGNGVDLANPFWGTASPTQSWSMVSIFGKAFNSGAFASVTSTADPLTQGAFTINGSSLIWTAVPEPSSALAGLLLGAGLLLRRRRTGWPIGQ